MNFATFLPTWVTVIADLQAKLCDLRVEVAPPGHKATLGEDSGLVAGGSALQYQIVGGAGRFTDRRTPRTPQRPDEQRAAKKGAGATTRSCGGACGARGGVEIGSPPWPTYRVSYGKASWWRKGS